MANTDFYVEYKDGKLTNISKSVKGLFNKKKFKKSSPEELFGYSKKLLKEDKYKLPLVEGLNKELYLSMKASYGMKNNFSDFETRTKWTFICKEDVCDEKIDKFGKYYIGCLEGNVIVKDENNNLIFEGYIKHPYVQNYRMTPKCLELLFQNATNGIYQNARDIEAFHNEMEKMTGVEREHNWICEECNEKFKTLDELFCHLIEEQHHDSILDCHPYDKECLRVRNLISESK